MKLVKNETVTQTSVKFDESVSRLREMFISINHETTPSTTDDQVLENVKIYELDKNGDVKQIKNAAVRFTTDVVDAIAAFGGECETDVMLCITCETAKRGEKPATFSVSTVTVKD